MSRNDSGKRTDQYSVEETSNQKDAGRRSRYGSHAETGIELDARQDFNEYLAVGIDDLVIPEAQDVGLTGNETPRGTERSQTRYVASRAEFAFSSAYLEGNSFTLPEVRTLLDGTTPAGKPTEDVDQILDLTEASEQVVGWARSGDFELAFDRADSLNWILVRHEAIDAGTRRINSSVNPDGQGATVNVRGDTFKGLDKPALAAAENVVSERVSGIDHPVLRATTYAAVMAYLQPYMDGNKRTARYMMDAELLSHGYDAIAIPAVRADEYQESLAKMFRTADTTPYVAFLIDVRKSADIV